MSLAASGLLVWATLEATTPGRDRLLISPESVSVAEGAPGTANFALRGLAPGSEGKIEVTVTYARGAVAEVRLFAVPTFGHSQSLAPHVELVIDDPADDAPAWTGTLDELRSLNSYGVGILPTVMSAGDEREYVFTYAIADDAVPSSQASVVLVWRAEPR